MKTKEKRTQTNFVKRVKEEEKEQINYYSIQNLLYNELNKLRQNPKCYIPLVEQQMKMLKKNDILRKKDSNLQIQTVEGKTAYEEAIQFLKTQKPVPSLAKESRLQFAANDLIKDLGERGVVSHQDSNGNFVSERIEKYCEWNNCANEVIEISSKNPEDILIGLIVDDGIRNRLDRKALFQDIYKYVGISCGYHSEYEIMTVFVFAGDIKPKGTLFNNRNSEYEYRYFNEQYMTDNNEKNAYLSNDPDAPGNTIGLRIIKGKKYLGNEKILVTKKHYKLSDGTEHIVEIEEF